MSEVHYRGISDQEPKKQSKLMKYGPAIFWGTLVALPAMNLTATIFQYRTAKLNFQTELLKTVTETIGEIAE